MDPAEVSDTIPGFLEIGMYLGLIILVGVGMYFFMRFQDKQDKNKGKSKKS